MSEPWTEWRSTEQNKLLQPACRDLANGIMWDSQGAPTFLTADEFRWLICADILGQKAVRGIHGGVVMLGGSSRQLTKQDATDAITLAFSIGDDPEAYGLKGQTRVQWSEIVCKARGISPNDDDMANQYG